MSTTFILGCARSGTTSLARALEASAQVRCLIEPTPNLNIESREMFESRVLNPYELILRDICPRIAEQLTRSPNYIEKQVSLVPFVPHLAKMLNCRFVIPYRDGREVVTSLINWHNQMYPIIYREAQGEERLGSHARQVRAAQTSIDSFDYSLPRPTRRDPWRESWKTFDRFEMVSWYWSFINRYIADQTALLDPARYLFVDYTNPDIDAIRSVYDFIGLSDFNADAVEQILSQRVNSLEDRLGEPGAFPQWRQWTPERVQRFSDIAFDTMQALGFADVDSRPIPPGFGSWWNEEQQDAAWYQQIYDYRAAMHDLFHEWCGVVEDRLGVFESVIDVGCGIGLGYTDLFHNRQFTGIDLSPFAIDYCQSNATNPKHRFVRQEIISDPPELVADLVMSHGTIDNTYDLDAFLRAMAKMTRRVLYVTNYRGYFGAMEQHRYLWDPATRVCFNDLSPSRVENVLREEGFETILIFPQQTHRDDIATETVIIASRESVDPEILMAHHEVSLNFASYRVEPSDQTHAEIADSINQGCAYYSESGLDLANKLSLFDQMLSDLREHYHPGTMQTLATDHEVNVAIRVDIDMDLVTAVEMARVAEHHSWPVSFYILHTAGYYGSFHEGVFQRNECNAQTYLQLQQSGCEVGLHIDPYQCYLEHGIDGAEAVQEELRWLRSIGLEIHGTSGHNVAPVYGAESFEIFKGRSVRPGDWYQHNYAYLPLGILDETELGLTYEAGSAQATRTPVNLDDPFLKQLPEGDFLRNPQWFRSYILDNPHCRWGYDYNIWILGKDMWAVAGQADAGEPTFLFDISWDEVNRFLAGVDPDRKVAITLHPIYFGRRSRAGEPPEKPALSDTTIGAGALD